MSSETLVHHRAGVDQMPISPSRNGLLTGSALLVAGSEVPRQIHRVMQWAKRFNNDARAVSGDTKRYEVPTFATLSRPCKLHSALRILSRDLEPMTAGPSVRAASAIDGVSA